MNRAALIDAAIVAVQYEARLSRPIEPETLASLRFDLASPRRYRDALDQIERDYSIDVTLPMALMDMLHERQALKAVA